jgi:hypothetical protein
MGMATCFASVSSEDLRRFQADPFELQEYLHSETDDPPDWFDVDKAWHAIHYMLCSEPYEGREPGVLVIMGGAEMGDENEYGPARNLTPEQVREGANFLDALPPQELAKRYAPAAMDAADIYPKIWVRDGAKGLDYILLHYEALRDYYRDMAAKGRGVFHWVS